MNWLAAIAAARSARGRSRTQRRLARFAAGLCLFAMPATSTIAIAAPDTATSPAPSVNANLNITPKRLTFSRGQRSATAYIYNQGNAPAAFDISIGDSVMLPSGEIQPLKDAVQHPEYAATISRLRSAKDFLIATPRRAVLAPGKGQTIRIRLTAPPDANAAEYRAHLTVSTVPPRSVGVTAEQAASAEQGNQLSFQVTSVFGVSIPVIVRSGPPDVRAHIAKVELSYPMVATDASKPPVRTPMLLVSLQRDGANSLFGNLEVRGKGKVLLGIARGVGVYPEIDSRLIYVPLQRAPAAGEALDISFVDDDSSPGRVIARTNYVGS